MSRLDTSVVVIPLRRYEELLDLETRVNVVVERVTHDKYFEKEDVLWVLGTDLAVDLAMEITKHNDEQIKKYLSEVDKNESDN